MKKNQERKRLEFLLIRILIENLRVGKIQKDPRGKDLFCKKININQNKNQG
jgi:hypothetical protein